MKTIVLISCVSKKRTVISKAKEMYISPLFKMSMEYAEKLNPDKIYILSAKHHLLEVDDEIEPYNVTLSNVPKSKRNSDLNVLNAQEKKEWGQKVLELLDEKTNLKEDEYIILAGNAYLKPISSGLKDVNFAVPLDKLPIGKRLSFLKKEIQ